MSGEVAIVGISAELPSGSYSTDNLDHESFFKFLMTREQSYERLPSSRFNIDSWKGNGPAEIHVDQGSFLKDIEMFDNSKKHGCFTSGVSNQITDVCEPDEYDAKGAFSGLPAMVANRISHHLDLLGPSLATDTACSSTLTALHLAMQAIFSGDCEAAVVGGCQLNHRFLDWIIYSQGGVLSKDGKCKPFDSVADGFSRAEGCVAIVIKPLEQALNDHDRIYATVLGTAINSTGSGAPPSAPVAESQRDVMIHAFKRARREPQEVDYVEAHATGTAKGDPTEVNWIGEHFRRQEELLIGSVKGNIGHTEIVAFLASLSKVVSMFKYGVIPPNVNLTNLNPAIHWDEYKLRVPTEPTKLPCRRNGRCLVAIASSGIGGSNGHAVIQSPPTAVRLRAESASNADRPVLLMACGLSPRSASSVAEGIQDLLKQDQIDLSALSTVLGRRSKQMTWRSFAVMGGSQSSFPVFSNPQHCSRASRSTVMIFSGQGPQHKDMGRVLFEMFPVFSHSVVEMDSVFVKATGKSLREDYGLFDGTPPPEMSDVWPISLILPSLAIFQIALYGLLVSLGVKPDIVLGHSAGETAVLYASGAGSKAMAIELAILRGRVFSPLECMGGTMAALSCGPSDASELLAQYRAEDPDSIVEIACFNSPSAVAIAGQNAAIDRVLELARLRDIFGRRIRTKVPIHSSMMEACRDEYCAGLRELTDRYPGPHVPQIPTYSTFTGECFFGPFDAQYFWDSARSQVRFTQAMEALGRSQNLAFIENAPRPVLWAYVSSMVDQSCPVLSTVRRSKGGKLLSEYNDILNFCGQLTAAGHNCVDFTSLNTRACYELGVPLPAYPFTKKQFPLYPDTAGYAKQMDSRRGPINHKYLKMNKETHPTLGEHLIRGEPIMPAAGYLEMALEFGASALMNVNLRSILSLSAEAPVKVNINLDGCYWTVNSGRSSSHARKGTEMATTEILHADGYLSFEEPCACDTVDISAIRRRCNTYVDTDFYSSLSYFSSYGPHLQRVTNAYLGSGEALVSVRGLDETLSQEGNYVLHPAILDACFHIMTYRPFHGDFNPNVYYLPSFVEAVVLHQPKQPKYFPAHVYAHVELTQWTPDSMYYNIVLADDFGKGLCTLQQFKMAKHRINPLPDISRPFDVILQPTIPHTLLSDLREVLDNKFSKRRISIKRDVEVQVTEFKHLSMEDGLSLPQDVQSVSDELEYVLLKSSQTLRNAILALGPTRQVVRLLVMSSVDELFGEVKNILRELPDLFFEISITDAQKSELVAIDSRSGIVRVVEIDLTDLTRPPRSNVFDFIIMLNSMSLEMNFEAVTRTCSRLLLPGGTLVLTELVGEAVNGRSHNFLQDPPSWSFSEYMLSHYLRLLQQARFMIFSAHCINGATGSHFITAGQPDPRVDDEAGQALFDPSTSLVFDYEFGGEIGLQQKLSQLDVTQKLALWILASEGLDGGSAVGLFRALRREYRSWDIRLVIFPARYTKEMQLNSLRRLPIHIQDEMEIVISSEGEPVVPRMLPLSPLGPSVYNASSSIADSLPLNHVNVSVQCSSARGDISGFLGIVMESNDAQMRRGSLVAGLTADVSRQQLSIDAESIRPISNHVARSGPAAAFCIPGFTTAIVAPGISTFNHLDRFRSLHILLTHCDTNIGLDVSYVYSTKGVKFTQTTEDASLVDLACLDGGSFDLVISGYTDLPHQQVLKTLLKPGRGRLFLWNDAMTGLIGIREHDPCGFGDALGCALDLIEEHMSTIAVGMHQVISTAPKSNALTVVPTRRTLFDPEKTYLLLGGVGSLGAHIAMYERGARHIVLTSRSRAKSLQSPKNRSPRRLISYLKEQEHLHIRLEAVDATSVAAMQALIASLRRPLGGCMILTAALSDGLFQHLTESDFSTSFASKSGVLNVMKDTMDIETLDFVVTFSSASGLFGVEGQSNYDASNTALEEALSSIPNAFSFICPGILDSSLMTVGDDPGSGSFEHLVEWALSTEDMICWLEDAIYRQLVGQRFKRYIPDLDWEALDRTLGMTKIGQHAVPTWTTAPVSTADRADGIAEVVQKVLNIPPDDFSPEVPLTSYGLDSLSASRLSFVLRPFVEVSQIQLLANMSLRGLQGKVSASLLQSAVGKQEFRGERSEADLMNELVAKYTLDMRPRSAVSVSHSPSPSEHVVLVTGTTGALGCHIVARLLSMDEVKHVYGFNRTSTTGTALRARQAAIFAAQGLPSRLVDSPKLTLVEGDLAAEDLGVSDDIVNELLSSVTHIIHNAWKVDFGTPLAGFEDLIKGTRRLLDLSTQSSLETPPSLSFVSSIAVYQYFGVLPDGAEAPILDAKVAARTGYLESKWIGERVVQEAGEKMSLRTNVIRIGLLTGSINGAWDTTHWLPALVQSGVHVGCLPDGDDVISWLPVDIAAAAIIDMSNTMSETLHLIHPRPVTWDIIMKPIASMLQVPLVPYPEWLARLQSSVIDTATVSRNSKANDQAGDPTIYALKLMDVYRGLQSLDQHQRTSTESMGILPKVASDKGIRASETLMDSLLSPPLEASDAEKWVGYWRNVKFLPEPH
ncbi:putative polyketide synthase [Sparassis crispa]|uniref:Putative polyketide synthase n=1 Tax=Sparassis crispa TaxID=139825 RepID=A0A401H623_9APHY|nr:putative polyketide synthase [Sparassis crispa]GBE89888.1 putative polyketide synthase [Sparassis crispa]